MEITLNGKAHSQSGSATVAELLATLDIKGRRVAVMINDSVIPKERFADTAIAAGDRVEVIHMVGGG